MNKYLEKIAEEANRYEKDLNHPYVKTWAKSTGRGVAEGLLGGFGGSLAELALTRGKGTGPVGAGVGMLLGAVHGAHASLKKSLSNKEDFDVKDPGSAAWRALGRGTAYAVPGGMAAGVGAPIGAHFGMKHSIQNTEKDGR